MKNQSQSPEIPLLPFSDFQKIAAKILSVTKEESDEQMKRFQAENPNGKAKKSEKSKTKKTS